MSDISTLSTEELLRMRGQAGSVERQALDPSTLSTEELQMMKAGKKPLEFKDAPTVASLPLPGVVKLPGAIGRWTGQDKPTIGLGDKASLMFGPLFTDNPAARQEIITKHLPGAKATTDKFGNPMIEYQGKRYYTARPGEIDAMDVGRATLGTAAALPAAMIAPASIPLAMVAGGTLAAGQSVAEDMGARALGGTSQKVDPVKAAIVGGIGVAAPPVAGAVGYGISKVAPLLYRAFGPSFIDAAGQLTQRGARFFQEAGINPANLEQHQIEQLAQMARRNMGNSDVGQPALRQMLGEEFHTPQTKGTITGDAAQQALEDRLRHSRGGAAETIMGNADARQEAALTAAQTRLQGGTPLQPPLTADEAGGVLQRGVAARNNAARTRTSNAYDDSVDPQLLFQMNVPPYVPMSHINQMAPAVINELQTARPGAARLAVNDDFPALFPRAGQMLDRIRNWSNRAGPRGTVGVNWEGVDAMRQELNQLRPEFNPAGGNRDYHVTGQIMNAFDRHLGELNPLLNQARDLHTTRMSTFHPGENVADANTRSVMSVLGATNTQGLPLNPGSKVMNNIFDASLKRGEALPAITHLESVYGVNSPEMAALKNEAIRRVTTDLKTGQPLSPQRTATAIQAALDGPQGDVYARLLTVAERRELQRFQMLNEQIATAQANRNPSGSGHLIAKLASKWGPVGVGYEVGKHAGGAIAGPPGAAVGAAVGAGGGGLVERLLARGAALRATAGGNQVPSLTQPLADRLTGLGVQGIGSVRGLLDRELQQ